MLLIHPALIILLHLLVQLLFVSEVGSAASGHLLALLGLKPLLRRNNLKELVTLPLSSLLDSSIIVSELILPCLVQLL